MNQALKNLQQKYIINLFDWYEFKSKVTGLEKDSKVLVLGDVDDNFIFPLAKRVGKIFIALETEEMANIVNYLSLPSNVTVYEKLLSDDIEGFRTKAKSEKYDYVLIPTLSQGVQKLVGTKLDNIINTLISDYTGNEGSVMLAFDNKFGFNVIGGSKLEENVLAFSYDEIDRFKNSIKDKKSDLKIYYPMPEYKFPLRIYSDKYLPKYEDEGSMARNLVEIGKLNLLCASYILIYDAKEKDNSTYEPIYVKYNLNRSRKFALRTSIEEDGNGNKRVIKKAIYKEANAHIRDIVDKKDVIKNKSIEVLKPIKYINENEAKDSLSYLVYPFIKGEMLTDLLLKRLQNGEDDREVITEYMFKIIGKLNGIIERYNLDCTFQNVIVSDDKFYVIDSEWVSNDTTEVDFLRYRILKYLYKSCKQNLPYSSFKDMVRVFSINSTDAERYENAENEFQSSVHDNIDNLDVSKYEELNPSFEKLYYVKAELERVREQLEKITGENNVIDYQATKQNEIIRLTNVHVNNLESIINNLQQQVTALTEQSRVLFKREGLIYKFTRKAKNGIRKILPPETVRSKICKYIYRTFRHPFKMLSTYFTSRGRNRIVGDFMIGDAYFECGKVAFPKCDMPKVSIIIPCFNQIRYTYRCLYSIMTNTNFEETPYEVIIADDVSTDTTKNIHKYVENVVVNRNEENLGFLKNCNAAAKLARGEYIYFLNNDTEVKPHYLSSLINLIESDDSIGMVGSKLIFADGHLQEAGGIIWSDGQGANYGRGDDPTDFKYNYVKEVDYISGAAIMIRKNLWNVIGGFDERYSPAYCEDSDLAFEVRKYGYKVMYQPLSEVIHYEGVSCGTDTENENSIKSYQKVNNEKLKEKWSKELQNHYAHTSTPNFFKARERGMNKKVILFIDHYVPTWDKDAGSKTVFSYMMMFRQKGYSVKFLGDNFILNSPYGDKLQQYGIEVLYGNNLQATIWEYLSENRKNIDYVFLNRPHIATKYIDFIRQNMTAKVIYYGHDLHYVRLGREYDLTGDENTLQEYKYYRNLEYSLLFKSDMSYYPSYKEVEEIRKVDDNLRVKAINAYMFAEKEIVERDFSKTKDIMFVGGFMHDPNKDAIRWLHESIMSRIKARNPEINLTVVGSNPTDEIVNICKEGSYNLLGYVSDEELINLYRDTRIVIAPLRYGAGIKGKIIEAMANAAAIVTTSCGAEGIVDAEKFMKIADDGLDFAGEVLKLYDDMNSLQNLSVEAQKVINNKYTMDAAWNIVKEDFE